MRAVRAIEEIVSDMEIPARKESALGKDSRSWIYPPMKAASGGHSRLLHSGKDFPQPSQIRLEEMGRTRQGKIVPVLSLGLKGDVQGQSGTGLDGI